MPCVSKSPIACAVCALLLVFLAGGRPRAAESDPDAGTGRPVDATPVQPLPAGGMLSAPAAAGWTAYQDGRMDAAREAFARATRTDPGDAFALFGLQTMAAGAGRYDAAFQHAVAALRAGAAGSPWLEVFAADALDLLSFSGQPRQLVHVLEDRTDTREDGALMSAFLQHVRARALTRSGEVAPGRRALEKMDFVRDWVVLGPMTNREGAGFSQEHGPEVSPARVDRSVRYPGRHGPVQWRDVPPAPPSGVLDLSGMLYPHEESVSYASTTLIAEDPVTLHLVFGTAGASHAWLGGRQLWREERYGTHHPFQRVYTVDLPAGPTAVLLKLGELHASGTKVSLLALPAEGGSLDEAGVRVDPVADMQNPTGPGPETPEVDGGDGLQWGAMGFFQEALGRRPSDAAALANLGYLYLIRGLDDAQHHRSRPLLERAADFAPACPLYRELAAVVQSDANVARQHLEAALEAHEEEVAAREILAAQAWEGGLIRRAERICRTILTQHPSAEAHRVLAEVLSGRGWRPEARIHAQKASSIRPRAPGLFDLSADLAPGRTRAREALEQGIRLTGDPDLLRRRVQDGLSAGAGEVSDLGRTLEVALADHPYRVADWLLLRDAHLAAGEIDPAAHALERGLRYLPEEPDLLEALGRVRLRQGRGEEAAGLWRRALAVAPDRPVLRRYLERVAPQQKSFFAEWDVPLDEVLGLKPDDLAPHEAYNAIVLLDQGVVRANDDGTADRFIHFCQQVLTPRGAQALSQHTIGYDPDRIHVNILAARVIQPDGAILAATDISDQTGERTGAGGIYSRYHYKRIRLPQVRPGSVVQIKYVSEATGPNLYGEEFDDAFFFGSENPTIRFQYVLDTPRDYAVQVGTHREDSVDAIRTTSLTDERRVRVWEAEQIPGIELEPGMPPFAEIAPSIRASSFGDWAEVGTWYAALSRDAFDLPAEIRAEARAIVGGAATETEKLEAIYYHVTETVRYVGIELGRSGYVPHRAERTWRTNYGDCKDTAVLFVALLDAVGIEAKVALVRTRDRGLEPTGVPTADQFNHAIAYVPDVDGRDWWLDGTTDYHRFGEVPLMDQGAQALVTGVDGGRFVRIPEDPASANAETIRFEAALAPGGGAEVDAKLSYTGAYAPTYRSYFEAEERFQKMLEVMVGRVFGAGELDDFATSGSDPRTEDVFFRLHFDAPRMGVGTGASRRARTVPLKANLSRRYARQDERKHDLLIDLPRERRVEAIFRLPEAAEPVLLEPIDLETRHGRLTRRCTRDGQTVRVVTEHSIARRRVPVEAYSSFRDFCHKVDAAEDEQIVYRIKGEEADPAGAGDDEEARPRPADAEPALTW
jgi:tetratricopeptide (TPR) repeat protein/transglutaminase-like putative cysteine protease